VHSGTVQIYSDSTGIIFPAFANFADRVGLVAGSTGFNAIHRSNDTTTGWYFPASATMAATTGGTERTRWSSSGFTIGASGTPIASVISATATLDFPSISTLTSADLTITVTGAATGDVVALGLPAAPTAGIAWNAFVSATNTVTVRAHNYTGSSIDPASAAFRVQVTKF
jgi:hypothetical protein